MVLFGEIRILLGLPFNYNDMKLVDLKIFDNYRDQPLELGTWYARLEYPDGFDLLKKEQKFSIQRCNELLVKSEEAFIEITAKFHDIAKECSNDEIISTDAPILWMNENNELKMTMRFIFKNVSDITALVEAIKPKMAENDVYLRVINYKK